MHITSLAQLEPEKRAKILGKLTDEEAIQMLHDWNFWARPDQLPPPGMDWWCWVMMGGRGSGKTRGMAEHVRKCVELLGYRRVALIGATAADTRDTMIDGESGILSVFPRERRPHYEPSKRRVTFVNGAVATAFSGDSPDRLRGPQHDLAWCDELAAWRFPDTWDMLRMGLRLGPRPVCLVSTTPKPVQHILRLMKEPGVVVTKATTYDNMANLAPSFRDTILGIYEGTRLGRQEIYAELIEDDPDALWQRELLDDHRVTKYPQLTRIVVGVDPPGKTTGAECGIIVGGISESNGHYYILGDSSLRSSPGDWGKAVLAAYNTHSADRIVAEINHGGEMVRQTLKSVANESHFAFKAVHATVAKRTRAEPIAALYEQGKVHHVGLFGTLEDQMCQWVPGDPSPDRVDALVWTISELMASRAPGTMALPGFGSAGITKASHWRGV